MATHRHQLLCFTCVGLKSFYSKHIYHSSTIHGTKLIVRYTSVVGKTSTRARGNRLLLQANLSSSPPKKKTHRLSTFFTLLGFSCMFLLARPVQAATWKQSARATQQQTAFIQTKSDVSFDRKLLRNEAITELAPADYLESCVDRDFQYTFSWTNTHEFYTLVGSVAFLVTFNVFTAFVDNFIQQQEQKEVQEELERFGRFLSPKTEYRDDVSLDKVDINMWKAQQRERSFYAREFSAQDMFEDKEPEEEEDREGGETGNQDDDGDVDHKNLERLLRK